jgi:bacteriocin-like protein
VICGLSNADSPKRSHDAYGKGQPTEDRVDGCPASSLRRLTNLLGVARNPLKGLATTSVSTLRRHDRRAGDVTLDMGDNEMNKQNDNLVRELTKEELQQVQGGLLVDNIKGWTYAPRDRDILQLDSIGTPCVNNTDLGDTY